jgi:hypothetical protein
MTEVSSLRSFLCRRINSSFLSEFFSTRTIGELLLPHSQGITGTIVSRWRDWSSNEVTIEHNYTSSKEYPSTEDYVFRFSNSVTNMRSIFGNWYIVYGTYVYRVGFVIATCSISFTEVIHDSVMFFNQLTDISFECS